MSESGDPHRVLHTPLCDLVGVKYPIVQTGMGWVAGPHLVTATALAGGLGILASATMTLDQLEQAIKDVRSRTEANFGVNLRTDVDDVAQRIELMVTHNVKVASFAQAPSAKVVEALREAGIIVMPTIGARRHAEKMADLGVHAVIAQGAEGGGHTGVVPTSLLIPDVVDAVKGRVEVIAAGGFFDGRGLVAALAYGASGIAMGTRFLMSADSRVPDAIKADYVAANLTSTIVTTKVDGAPQRVIVTDFIRRLERTSAVVRLPRAVANAARFRRESNTTWSALLREGRAMKKGNELTWAQVTMAANAPVMTKAALVDGRRDGGILPTGQVAGVIGKVESVAEIVERIMTEADQTIGRLAD